MWSWLQISSKSTSTRYFSWSIYWFIAQSKICTINILHDSYNIAWSKFSTIYILYDPKFWLKVSIQILLDPKLAQSKSFALQILCNPNLVWSCVIQILCDLAWSKSCVIQILSNPNTVWAPCTSSKFWMI